MKYTNNKGGTGGRKEIRIGCKREWINKGMNDW